MSSGAPTINDTTTREWECVGCDLHVTGTVADLDVLPSGECVGGSGHRFMVAIDEAEAEVAEERGICATCGADIVAEDGEWFHDRVEDGSHEPTPKAV